MLLYFKNVIYKQGTYGYLQEVTVETVRFFFFKQMLRCSWGCYLSVR